MKSKNLLIINQMSGYLFIDIANYAVQKYNSVVLMTGSLHPLMTDIDKSVKIVYIKKYNRKSVLTRFVSWVFGFVQIAWLIKFRYRNYEVLASSNPPIASWLPLIVPNKTHLVVLDVYPEALSATRMMTETHFIYRFWEKLNQISYKRFKNIYTLTNGMKDQLAVYKNEKVHVVPPWPEKFIKTSQGTNIFIEKFCLQDKFIVLYSGNLGREYDIECLADVARNLRPHTDIIIVVAGKGWRYETLKDLISKESLRNMLLIPFQDADGFNASLNAMHIGVVVQARSAPKVCIPSKIYNIMAFSKPILCIGSNDTDLGRLVTSENLGSVFMPSEVQDIADFILTLFMNKNIYSVYCAAVNSVANKFTKSNAATIVDTCFNSRD